MTTATGTAFAAAVLAFSGACRVSFCPRYAIRRMKNASASSGRGRASTDGQSRVSRRENPSVLERLLLFAAGLAMRTLEMLRLDMLVLFIWRWKGMDGFVR